MKTMLMTLLLALIGWNVAAQEGKLTIKWTYLNVVEGFDHENKVEVWIDGKRVGESGSYKETETGTYTINVPTGMHTLRVVGLAYYEGEWEEHTIENDYSIDAIYDESCMFGKKNTLNIAWDIDLEKTKISFKGGKAPKAPKGGAASLTVTWNYSGIIEGYDHICRMKVYVDGKLVATSKEQKQSVRGRLDVPVKTGSHTIRIVNETLYEGKWEEHTKDNEYSVDAFTEGTYTLKTQNKVHLLFDITDEDTTVTWDIK